MTKTALSDDERGRLTPILFIRMQKVGHAVARVDEPRPGVKPCGRRA
jgi:hypothetical protein